MTIKFSYLISEFIPVQFFTELQKVNFTAHKKIIWFLPDPGLTELKNIDNDLYELFGVNLKISN
jgi:hypothetical protein